jgi:D-tyrosyl-tRNA(Tyr) deacylase
MRALIQRVHSGSVSVRHSELHNHALPPSHPSQPEPQSIKTIGKGAVVFLGISSEDTLADCDYVLRKTMSVRLWPDNNNNDDAERKNKQWTKSLLDLNLDVLFVSQFTLLAECTKGKKPSFSRAMTPKEAKEMYDEFLKKAREEYKENGIKEGQFGAMMDVHIENDGPVTVLIDSQNKGG